MDHRRTERRLRVTRHRSRGRGAARGYTCSTLLRSLEPLMRGCHPVICLVGSALSLVARPATAQTPTDSFRLAFDLGYVNTAGNTAVTTLNFGEHLSYLTGKWTLAHGLIAIEGRSEGVETAAQYRTDLRVDRALAS